MGIREESKELGDKSVFLKRLDMARDNLTSQINLFFKSCFHKVEDEDKSNCEQCYFCGELKSNLAIPHHASGCVVGRLLDILDELKEL